MCVLKDMNGGLLTRKPCLRVDSPFSPSKCWIWVSATGVWVLGDRSSKFKSGADEFGVSFCKLRGMSEDPSDSSSEGRGRVSSQLRSNWSTGRSTAASSTTTTSPEEEIV